MEYVWSAFLSLHSSRGQGMNGPLPISYSEIAVWQSLTGNTLSPWEVESLKRLDTIYVRVINERHS